MDEQGYFYHLARLKDIVIRGGENIYPKEIEDFLHKHPKIADVYAVGVPDARMGEELCACVKLVRDQSMTDKELREFCKDKVILYSYFYDIFDNIFQFLSVFQDFAF